MGKYVNGVYVPDEEEYYDALHPKGAAVPTQQQPVATDPNKTLNKTTQVAEEVNPYADRAAVQAAINQPAQPAPVQQPNLFAQQKQAYLASPQAQGKAEVPTVGKVASAVTPMPKERVVKQLPIDPNSSTDGLNSVLGNWTSKEDEEKYRKASVARQRIMAVADALRHIGNIYHTAKYAPSQKFTSPVEQERARYQQEKALRDKANERIMTYQMAKQKLDNDQNRWEAEQKQKQANWNATYKYNQEKDAADRAEKQRQYNLTLELNKQKAEDARKHQEEMEKQGRERNKIARGHLGVAWKNADTNAKKAKVMEEFYKNGGRGGYRTGNGYNYATKNGYVTLKSDYLKNNINKESIVNQMKNSNFVDDEWKKQYEIAKWTNQDDEMLDEAISNWLMNDDNAEYWMKEHFGDNGGVHVPLAGTMPGVANGESGTTMPGVKQ